MKPSTIILFLGLIMFATGCDKENAPDIIKTRGDRRIERRELSAFQSIAVSNGINVVLQQGDRFEASLDGWENLMPKIHTTVDGEGRLIIEDVNTFNMMRSKDNMTTVYLSAAGGLTGITLTGNGDITSADTLHTSSLYILCEEASGNIDLTVETPYVSIGTNSQNVASITLRGICSDVGITNWGYAPIDLLGLRTLHAEVHHRGTGNITVNASETLNAVLYALGDLYYLGTPVITLSRKGKGNLYKAIDN